MKLKSKAEQHWVRREIIAVLVLKVAALIAIKLLFFSDAPAVTEQSVSDAVYSMKPEEALTRGIHHDRSR